MGGAVLAQVGLSTWAIDQVGEFTDGFGVLDMGARSLSVYAPKHVTVGGEMEIWKAITKKREGPERFVTAGLGIAIAGAGIWLWSVVTDRDDSMRTMAVTYVVMGLLFAGIAMAVIAYRKRDRSDS